MLNNFFSIGIPIFNQQLFLDKCLNSILLQDFINYEVIMVDDGSTDESAKICKKFSEKSTRFKYIYQENSGVSAARNTILKKSTGMYLIMIDSDDYIEKGMFKALYEKIMEFKNIELIRFKSEVVNDKPGKDIYRFNYTEEIPSPISGVEALAMWSEESKSKYAVPWLYCVKRELYSGIEFPVGRVHEDFAIYPIILARAQSVVTLNKICYYYVQHLNSLMNTQNIDKQIKKLEDWMINYSNLVSELNKIFEEKNVSEYLRYTILDDLRDRTVDRIWSFRK